MSIAKRALSTIEGLAPIAILYSAFIYGVLLLLAAFALHLDVFTDPGSNRLFGFVREVNWGFNYVLIIPVALFFATATINAINSTIGDLARSHMVVGKAGPLDEGSLLESWHRYGQSGLLAAAGFSIIAVLVSGYEWVTCCLLPAIHHKTYDLAPGWNIGWHSVEQAARPVSCALFGFFAFTAQAAVAVFFLLFATLVVSFAMWTFDYTKDSTAAELFPNPRSSDNRRGFEHFGSFIENLLLASVAFFFVFFMTRLDALYIHSTSSSISSFIGQNIFLKGFTSALRQKGAGWLFDFGNTADASTTLVAAGFSLAAVLAFLVPSIIVRQAAMRSQQRYLTYLEENPRDMAAMHEMAPEKAKSSITKMEFWPIRYPRFQLLLVFVSFAGICFACYRLTLTIFLMLLIAVVRKALVAMGLVRPVGAPAMPDGSP